MALYDGLRVAPTTDFVAALLQDRETTVRDEARTALEQLDNPELVDRLQTLLDEGLLI